MAEPTRLRWPWRLALSGALLILVGCSEGSGSPGAGGDGAGGDGGVPVEASCTPNDETQADFAGFAASETNISLNNPSCGGQGKACVAAGFQGRVSCPYGQTQDDLALQEDDPKRCRVTDASGTPTSEPVTVPVKAQLVERQARDAVFCSCRCAGPDPMATYCECPSGATCVELVPGLGLSPGSPVEGSYCVPAGVELEGDASGETCSLGSPRCGGASGNP